MKPYPSAIHALVPRDRGDYGTYYSQNDAKHFTSGAVAGSKFLDPTLERTEDVLVLALGQRGDLAGDDRDMFLQRGCDLRAFHDGVRYLFVSTPGTVGIVHSSMLDPDTAVFITQDKVGAPCSASVVVERQPITDYACVVIGRNEEDADQVWTTFPGPPTPPGTGVLDDFKDQQLTVQQIREIFSGDINLLTRLV